MQHRDEGGDLAHDSGALGHPTPDSRGVKGFSGLHRNFILSDPAGHSPLGYKSNSQRAQAGRQQAQTRPSQPLAPPRSPQGDLAHNVLAYSPVRSVTSATNDKQNKEQGPLDRKTRRDLAGTVELPRPQFTHLFPRSRWQLTNILEAPSFSSSSLLCSKKLCLVPLVPFITVRPCLANLVALYPRFPRILDWVGLTANC